MPKKIVNHHKDSIFGIFWGKFAENTTTLIIYCLDNDKIALECIYANTQVSPSPLDIIFCRKNAVNSAFFTIFQVFVTKIPQHFFENH